MAELIDKDALRRNLLEKQVTKYYDSMEKREVIGETVALLDILPTTTESEIRAKAIDEFAERVKQRYFFDCNKRDIDIIAEQLKERE